MRIHPDGTVEGNPDEILDFCIALETMMGVAQAHPKRKKKSASPVSSDDPGVQALVEALSEQKVAQFLHDSMLRCPNCGAFMRLG